ncbi:MAG: XrtA/PEP-CTERM system TPR-repeat protein PrsT [Acetobacteraceae bacterium]
MRYKALGWIGMVAWIGMWPGFAYADYLSSARAAMKKGDLKTAQIELRNAIRNDPQNAEAHYWLGRVSLELGDPVAAERSAFAARERGYDAAQVVPLIAQSLLTQNKFEQLLEALKPEGRNPALDAAILVARGYALIGLKRPDDAQQAFAEAERVAPNAVEPLLAGARLAVARADLAAAQAKIDRALAAQPKSVEALLAKSQLLRLKSDTAGAMSVLDELIADQPGVMQARLDRASLALAMGRNDVAKLDIETVLKATPGNVQGIYLRAVMAAQARNFKAADADLDRIAAYVSRIQRAYYLQAVVKEQLGQFEQAEEAARKYLARAPNDLAAYKVLARIQFAKRRPDLVIDTLAKVAESGKGDAETFDLLGRAYAATNRPTDAVQSFQKAESLAPNDVGVQTRLASVRMGMGEVDAAVGDLEQTLQLAPKLPAVGEALFFAALATGDPEKAADALAKVREAQGDTEVVDNLEGLYKLSMIDIAGAEATFAALVKKHPDFHPAKVNLSRVLAMQGKVADAERLLAGILSRQPTSEPALSMLASSYVQSGRLADAIGLVERALAADPENVRLKVSLGDLFIRSGTPQKALEIVNQEKGGAANSTDILSLRAAAQLALGQKKEARATYIDLLKQDPNLVGARRQLVALLIEAGDFESARTTLTAGIAATPRNYQLYQDFVMIDLRSTGLEAAMATADRLIAQDRDFPTIRALKGDVYLSANRPLDAINAFNESLKVAPSGLLTTRLAGAMIRAGKVDDAITVLTDWIRKNPEDVQAMAQLAEIYIVREAFPDAARYLEAVLKIKPHESVALNNLAWVYQQLGDSRAQALARQAYVLSPGAQTADTLGWILTKSGNARDGVALLRQANAELATDPRLQYHFAVALKETGDKEEAIRQLNKVIETKGEFREKVEARQLLEELTKGS